MCVCDVCVKIRMHNAIEPGKVGLSFYQRTSAKVSSGVPCRVSVFIIPKNLQFTLTSIRLQVGLLSQRKCELSDEDLSQIIKQRFNNHVCAVYCIPDVCVCYHVVLLCVCICVCVCEIQH